MKILGFTGSRAEYYILRPLFIKLSKISNINLELIVTGGITKELNSKTLEDIKNDGAAKITILDIPGKYKNHNEVIGYLCLKMDPIIRKINPDLCIVYADRYESFAYAITATHLNRILLHLEAGDITEGGTYDDYIRHCISKMSHIFCTSTKNGIKNVMRLGEENWRIMHSGLLSYDDMKKISSKDQEKVLEDLDIKNNLPIIIATMHPIPLNIAETKRESKNFFKALQIFSLKNSANIIITSPNLDEGRKLIIDEINTNLPKMKNTFYTESLGGFRYQALMSLASSRNIIICGNSSSIIKEAPYYNAQCLNIGIRQRGREKSSMQIDCMAEEFEILENLEKTIRAKFEKCINPYYVENASDKVISFIKDSFTNHSREKLINKKWNRNY